MAAPGEDADEVLRLAASLDQASPHVVAAAVVAAAARRGLVLSGPSGVTERQGTGVEGEVDGHRVQVGGAAWLGSGPAPVWLRRLRRRAALDGSLLVLVTRDGRLVGGVLLDDPLRPDAPRTVRALRVAGIERIVLVTGDRADVADAVGRALRIDEVLADRAPSEKLDAVAHARPYGPVVMVGDGINDAPALAAADVGVALGARGATASSEAADVVLVVDRLDRLADALAIARRARRIARQSVVGGMGLSLAAMAVAAWGLLTPTVGAVLQEGIDVLAILNALRVVRPLPRVALLGRTPRSAGTWSSSTTRCAPASRRCARSLTAWRGRTPVTSPTPGTCATGSCVTSSRTSGARSGCSTRGCPGSWAAPTPRAR